MISRTRLVTFYEETVVVERVISMIREGSLPNIKSLSEYCRRSFRLVAAYPELLTEGEVRIPSKSFEVEQLRELERNLSFLIEKNFEAIQGVSQQLVGLKNWIRENPLRIEVVDMVDSLLRNPSVFSARTISELESFYPHVYMREFTPEILLELKKRGIVRVEPGDRLRWLRNE